MTISIVGAHDAVPPPAYPRLPTHSSGVCRCGAVYDYGNVAVPPEQLGMCGRCAFLQLQLQLRLNGPRAGRPIGDTL